MVYTGKPSRGCQMCKTRRIKCDEKRPICSQCKKSGRTCPGYQDEFDLIFRDENIVQERKARKASGATTTSQGSSSKASPSSFSEQSPVSTLALRSESPRSQTLPANDESPPFILPTDFALFQAYLWQQGNAVPPVFPPSTEVQATAFFFRNFVVLPQQAESMRGFLELLVPKYNEESPSSALHSATHAVALSTLGNYPGRQNLLQDASIAYGQALTKLNVALQDPIESKSDATILAVLLFSLYEAIMATPETVNAWANHVDGAVALVKLRGNEQFKNPFSYSVFRAVRTMMITSCVQRSIPVTEFPGEYGWIGSEHSEENAANRLTLISIDLPNVRTRAHDLLTSEKTPETEAEVLSLIGYAEMVDANLENWAHTLPDDWNFSTTKMVYDMPEDVENADEWPGPQHTYGDVFIANIVNDYRVSRIFCQSVILGCVTWMALEREDHQIERKCARARFVIQSMTDEIAASVPFHMNYDLQPVAKQLGQDQSAAEALGAYFLVWPLFVAGNTDVVPIKQRKWFLGRLNLIGREFGLSNAQILAMARRHVLTCGPIYVYP
ncbi:uncharacterized protein BDZ99DRAFT_447247 [Mytilinidion resinicola]|uniref:Zn(2)-C6 fungal-type domain-containing protein n=1 Tax=Mytilinidion resinicola TaxID=574789 RepID=A0A6A6YGY7_9PEZI|nr:uncharacterized protein BDZ99DRAFT_447247 [Mytilinidion resinicola]KAF2808082.1 hypothetical protein BDZ99DRAFT_447247 [Mytilinidion resinicola]